MCTMLFAGPTGVGKTESARIIANIYYGSSTSLIKLNMGEYADELSYNKIIGSAPGYVGYDDDTGLLSSIKKNPCSVVLFDEIEKAHPKVLKALLSMMDDGIVNDSHGDKVSFRNAIIIFTTNLGYDSDSTNSIGMGAVKIMDDKHEAEMAVKKYFPPEFAARINKTIIFNRLDDRVFTSLIERYRAYYEKLSNGKVRIEFSKQDVADIKKAADVENKGARGLDEAVRNQIQTVYVRGQAELANKAAKAAALAASKKGSASK
jgi:ATP-dependent Clp protease ATP-binding subunit ClpA